jgi:sugar lactone lactonase YvrE
VADPLNNRIRRIRVDTGIVDCIAGASSAAGYVGDGGSALAAQLNYPNKLEFGPDGRLYVADRFNNAIRAIDIERDQITTVAGNGQPCADTTACYRPDDGLPATQIQLNEPNGLAFDHDGNLYVADTLNSRIVRIAK